MIETIENAFQLALIAVCLALAVIYTVREKPRNGTLLVMFYGSYLLGDLYWLLYLLFYGDNPSIFYIPDLSWYAAYGFLYLILQRLSTKEERQTSCPAAWLTLLFTGGMGIYYIIWYISNGYNDGYISTAVSAVLMSLLLFHSVRGLAYIRSHPEAGRRRMLYIVTVVFVVVEHLMWTASCIWTEDTPANPYYWFDVMMTINLALFLPAFRKAVRDE